MFIALDQKTTATLSGITSRWGNGVLLSRAKTWLASKRKQLGAATERNPMWDALRRALTDLEGLADTFRQGLHSL